jgi:hypothetical protein
LFLRLVSLGEGTEDTRRRALQSELLSIGGADMPLVLDVFGESRLLTFDTSATTHTPTAEVAHEALIREWGRLRVWLDESRDDIRQQRLLETAAAEWRSANRDSGYLLTSSRLDQFVEWAVHTQLELTPDEQDYLNSSMAEGERQRQLEMRGRPTSVLWNGAPGACCGTGSRVSWQPLSGRRCPYWLWIENSKHRMPWDQRASAAESKSLFLAAAAENALNDHETDLAVALVMEALRMDPDSQIGGRRWSKSPARAELKIVCLSRITLCFRQSHPMIDTRSPPLGIQGKS